MKYNRRDYENFLNAELEIQIKEYARLVETKALTLKSRGEVFVGRFLKVQPNGIAIFKVRVSDNMPRKNSFWTATYFIGDMGSFKNWGDLSWTELRDNYQKDYSGAHCVWIGKSDSPDFCLVGVKGISIEFAELLENEKPIIAFGPNDPPLKYLKNLIDIVRDEKDQKIKSILDYDATDSLWNPQKIESTTNFTELLLKQLEVKEHVVIQGPPGTGKTYRMAQLTAQLLKENNSVLVTALTNQALMELAKKDDLQSYIQLEKVSKTSLTIDEKKELPNLQPIVDNECNAAKGFLSLATFYVSSEWAKDLEEIPFDYIIMDEASQALLPMVAASLKLGKKVIWIGDQNQLSPIVLTNEDIINKHNWGAIVKGFETLCNNFSYTSFMLSDTFRLTKRGAGLTGIFYNNSLRSVSETQQVISKIPHLNKDGGTSLLSLDLKIGEKSSLNALDAIFDLVKKITEENPKAKIAILAKFRESVRQLQKDSVLRLNSNEISENIIIETVDRVQGLTVDYCIFFIPNASIIYSLEKELFNVATSRARFCTIIVADKFLMKNNMPDEVRKYILKTQEDKFITFETPKPKKITAGNINVTVVDKVDLSKFERKRTEIVEGKENIYIIDTNVFINCPDIISKIGKQYKVIIPAKVLEELDKLKLKNDINKKNLNNAAKNICSAFSQNFSKMEDGDPNLLPASFDKKNPDCIILSVALKFKEENPILLTSDHILQTRAKGLGITTISLNEFLRK